MKDYSEDQRIRDMGLVNQYYSLDWYQLAGMTDAALSGIANKIREELTKRK